MFPVRHNGRTHVRAGWGICGHFQTPRLETVVAVVAVRDILEVFPASERPKRKV